MNTYRHVKLFKNGRNQAVRIPREFELPGDDAIMRRDGDKLIIEAAPVKSLLAILAGLEPFDAPADAAYAQLRRQLEGAGAPIGGNDMLIAAHAAALACVVVTDNVREVRRIAGLPVENWLR